MANEDDEAWEAACAAKAERKRVIAARYARREEINSQAKAKVKAARLLAREQAEEALYRW